jgi:RNA polymerase sigma-70 factor (ECF subfamily)
MHTGTLHQSLPDESEQHERFLKMNESIRKLDVKYQNAISLRFFEQKAMKEIALILGKKEGTVKSLISRGIEKLREDLKSEL